MLYALAVISRWFCPPKREQPAGGAELESSAVPAPADPVAPPSSPVIQPVAQPVYPSGSASAERCDPVRREPNDASGASQRSVADLPTLNPSLVREEGDDTYSV